MLNWATLVPIVISVITGAAAVVNTVQVLRPFGLRISWRVHLDSAVDVRANIDIKSLAELVVRRRVPHGFVDMRDASVVLIRVSNDGWRPIETEDYLRPVEFRFGTEGRHDPTAAPRRTVVGVQVTPERGDEALLDDLLGTARDAGGRRTPAPGQDVITFDEDWLLLPKVQLNRGDRFRMVVLLEGTDPAPRISASGRLKAGEIKADPPGTGRPSGRTLRAFGFGAAATLSLIVLALVLTFGPSPSSATGARCVAGSLTVSGSTAFAPAMAKVATRYHQACSASDVAVNPPDHPTGSHQGVLDLATKGKTDVAMRAGQLAMSDGPTTGFPELEQQPVAVIIFSVVVNKATGVHSLTEAELRSIYAGRITNWSALHGPDLPIRIVSRGADSGTRSTFDQKVLNKTAEPAASSYNCVDHDPNLPNSTVIRCEMQSTGDVLAQVNAIPGAIGYAEMSATSDAQPAHYPQVQQIQLDGYDASAESVKNGGYPFWAVEYLYSYGTPNSDSLSAAFLEFLAGDSGKAILQGEGHVPCTDNAKLCR